MNRLTLLGVSAALLFGVGLDMPAFSAPAVPPPAATRFSAEETADLKRVSAYLNSLRNVEGSFLQIGGDGSTEHGTFYLKRPGRVRFEYEKPNPNLIIADGTTVAIENSDLKTTDRYPLVNSPLRLLLSDNADLSTDPRIVAVTREAGAISVTAREDSGPAQGSITLTFADSGANLELRQWEVTDAQGTRTLIVLDEIRQVADIPARLFVIRELSPFQRGNR